MNQPNDINVLKARRLDTRAGWVCLALLLLVNAIFLRWNAFRGFNHFDMGCMLDASWRVFQGQEPYVDFLFITGPMHLYMNAFFYMFFGFGKAAILITVITLSSAVALMSFLIARSRLSLWLTVPVVALTLTSFSWPFSHPWYDQSAFFWGILAMALLVLQTPFKSARLACGVGFVCGMCGILAFMCKTNIGFMLMAALGFSLLASPKRIAALIGFTFGALTMLGVIFTFLIQNPKEFYDQVFVIWGGNQSERRFGEFLKNGNWVYNHPYWIVALIVAMQTTRKTFLARKEHWALYLGLVAVAIVSNLTSSSIHKANMPLLGIFAGLSLILLRDPAGKLFSNKRRQITSVTFIAAICILTGIFAQYGLQLKIWSYTDQPVVGDYTLKHGPLRGWRMQREEGEDLDQLMRYIHRNIPPEEKILILSDLVVLYATSGRDSFRGVTHSFLPGDFPAQGRQVNQVRTHILNNLPEWIITHHKPSSFVTLLVPYLGLANEISTQYRAALRLNRYTLLRKVSVP